MSKPIIPLPPHLQALIELLPLGVAVRATEVFEKYGRKPEYARRIRKIESEYGWSIERVRGNRGANDDYYIRRSDGPVKPQCIRVEVSKAERDRVYARDQHLCQLCGDPVGTTGKVLRPQCDHRIPAERGGPTKFENLQTLCIPCNLKKRQACKRCALPTCDDCEYAFPERLAGVVVLRLSAKAAERLAARAAAEGVTPSDLVERMLGG